MTVPGCQGVRAASSNGWWLLKLALALLVLASLAFFSGGVIFIGPLLVSLTPDLLLLAEACAVTFAARAFTENRRVLVVVFVLAMLLLGLNTRIPALFSDLSAMGEVREHFGERQSVGLSQPLRVMNGEGWIRARRFPYASAIPSCYGDGCFVISGLRTPMPHYGRDYWIERPEAAVLDAGLTLARSDERVPQLEVAEHEEGHILSLELKLLDSTGASISSVRYRYRNGFPLELADDSKSVDATNTSAELTYNFLFHSNLVNRLVGHLTVTSPQFPIRTFLSRSFSVGNSQALASGTTNVALEVLGEEVHEPPLLFRGERGESAKDPWPEKGWDAERTAKCRQLLRRESPQSAGGTTQDWWLFVKDPTGRKKIRLTGNELCDDDAIWSFDYVAKRPRLGIKKYKSNGELQYDLGAERPPSVQGFYGRIRERTFHEQDGYVYFEWMDTSRSGFDLSVKRNMSLRFALPPT